MNYLIKLIILTTLVILSNKSNAQVPSLMGKYQTNISAYGMFREILELKCDSSFIIHFQGDLLNDSGYGKWSFSGKNLMLNPDTLKTTSKRYKSKIFLTIKKDRLFKKTMSKAEYSKLKKEVNASLPKYSEINSVPTNFNGGKAKQFLQRIEAYKCNG